jgi:hypothetical protein
MRPNHSRETTCTAVSDSKGSTLAIKGFLKGTVKVTVSVFLALVALFAAVAIYLQIQESREREAAMPFEEVKPWQFDLREPLGVAVGARTKLVSGRLLVSIEVTGHSKYFVDPRNQEGSLIFEFLDKDGFKVVSRTVKISEFTTVVGRAGEPIGLRHQYDEYLDVERYRQLSRMQVGWNLVTELKPPAEAAVDKPVLDHCALGLSKAERLKRLAQHGQIRQTGNGSYSAGSKFVTFFEFDGSLLGCR